MIEKIFWGGGFLRKDSWRGRSGVFLLVFWCDLVELRNSYQQKEHKKILLKKC